MFTPALVVGTVQLVNAAGGTFFKFQANAGTDGEWDGFHGLRIVILENTRFQVFNSGNVADIHISGFNLTLP